MVVLLSDDESLKSAWQTQIPAEAILIDLVKDGVAGRLRASYGGGILIADVAHEEALSVRRWNNVLVYVGEPGSEPYESTRVDKSAKVLLSYGESLNRLGQLFPLLSDSLKNLQMIALAGEGVMLRESGVVKPATFESGACPCELWDIADGLLDAVGSREALIQEFKRAARSICRCSAVFLLFPRGGRLISDCGKCSLGLEDPIVSCLARDPVVLDGNIWPVHVSPIAQVSIRGAMTAWGARLLVPIHNAGELVAIMVFKVREDGAPFGEKDRANAVGIGRLLRQCLELNQTISDSKRFLRLSVDGNLTKHNSIVLSVSDDVPESMPIVIRDLVGRVRKMGGESEVFPDFDQPYRGKAKVDKMSSAVWVFWDNCEDLLLRNSRSERASKLEFIRELSMTLNHEIGNSLVPLAAFRQWMKGASVPAPLSNAVCENLEYLQRWNAKIARLSDLINEPRSLNDVRDLVAGVCARFGMQFESGPDLLEIYCMRGLVELALEAIADSIDVGDDAKAQSSLVVRLRCVGLLSERVALVAIRGVKCGLEGVLPEPVEGQVPNQGKFMMMIAKEIIRLHGGEVRAGPGLDAPEILISIRSI